MQGPPPSGFSPNVLSINTPAGCESCRGIVYERATDLGRNESIRLELTERGASRVPRLQDSLSDQSPYRPLDNSLATFCEKLPHRFHQNAFHFGTDE
jgi:hypothetical protein